MANEIVGIIFTVLLVATVVVAPGSPLRTGPSSSGRTSSRIGGTTR